MKKKMISLILAILIICASVPLSAVQAFALDMPPATGFDNAEPIALGETKTLEFEERGQTVLLKFTVPEDGEYVLAADTSDSYVKDHFRIEVYDQNYWDFWTLTCFLPKLPFALKAGETVYFDCGLGKGYYRSSYNVTMLACPEPTGMRFATSRKELNQKTGDKNWDVDVKFEPEYAKEQDIFWTSDDPDIVEITECWSYSARYECKAAGSTVIRAHTESGLECSIPINVTDYEVFAPGETKTIEYIHDMRAPTYVIVPEKSGMYTFKSASESKINAWINDENKNTVASAKSENLSLNCCLEAGKKYYFSAILDLIRGSGTFDVTAEYDPVYITGIEVLSPPNNTNPEFERFDEFPECEGLKLRTTWSDGQTVDWTFDKNDLYIRGFEVNLKYDQDYVFGEDYVDIFIVATCGGMSTQIKLEPTPVPKKIDLEEYDVNEDEFLAAANGERMIADIDLTGEDYERFFKEMGIAPESLGKSLIFNDMYTLTNENNIKMCLTKAQIYKAAELDCVENLGVSPDPDNWSTLQCTKGDVNGDKSLDITDAVNIQRYAVDKTKFSATQENLGDFNNDGKCDALDSTAIQRALVSE